MKNQILLGIAIFGVAVLMGCNKNENGSTNNPEGEYSSQGGAKPNRAGITPGSMPGLIKLAMEGITPEFREQYKQGIVRLVLDTNKSGDIFVIGVPGKGDGVEVADAFVHDFSMDSVLFAVMLPRE